MIWQLKILLNYLNPRLRLVSISDNLYLGSYHTINHYKNEIRHGSRVYTWHVK